MVGNIFLTVGEGLYGPPARELQNVRVWAPAWELPILSGVHQWPAGTICETRSADNAQDSESETYIALATRVNVCRRGGPLRPSRAGATNVRVWGPPAGAPQGCSPTSHLLCLISALFQSPRIIASRIWAGVFPCFVIWKARKVSAMQMPHPAV